MRHNLELQRTRAVRLEHWSFLPFQQWISAIYPQDAHRLPVAILLQQIGVFLQIPPHRQVTEFHPESRQCDPYPSQAYSQYPVDRRQLAQSQGLIRAVHPLRIAAKCVAAVAAAIALGLHTAAPTISHRLAHFAPALKGCSLTIRTFLRASSAFALDIWQLKDDSDVLRPHRHDRLLVMAVCRLPSYKELSIFVRTHRLNYRQ